MKNLCICLILSLFLALPTLAFSQEWITANQTTITWDAVTTLSDGTPLSGNDTIAYTIYLSNAITDPDKDNPAEIDTIEDTQKIITLVNEGQYFVGLKSIRKLADGTVVGESDIGWSDDPTVATNGDIFGIRYFLPPAIPTNMRPATE